MAQRNSTPQRDKIAQLIAYFSLLLALSSPNAECESYPEIDAEISRIQDTENISALAYGIVDATTILWQRAHGHYSAARKRTIDLNSLFRVGSITKSFTALAALHLAHESSFSIDSPVKDILRPPPFVNHWPQHPITVEMLLEHTAGFTDMSKKEFDQLNPLPLQQAFLVAPASRITRWTPGLHSSYSNSGAGIVAAVIEKVSNTPFEQYLDEHVFEPLELNSATLFPPHDVYENLVRGYDEDGRTSIPYWHQLYRAFGALNISTADMLRYIQMLLNEGNYAGTQVFPTAVIKSMTKVTTSLGVDAKLNYGYAKGLYHFQRNGVTFYGHGGDGDGYLAYLAFSPQINRAYFIVFNAYKPVTMKKLRAVLENALTRNAMVDKPPIHPLSTADMEALLGEYEAVTHRFANQQSRLLRVFSDNAGGIFTQTAERAPRRLIPVSAKLFRRPAQSIATIALCEYQGHTYLQGDLGNYRKLIATEH